MDAEYSDGLLEEQDTELNVSGNLSPEQFVSLVTQERNLVPLLEEGMSDELAQRIVSDYEADKGSSDEWRERMEKGIELAKLVKDEKSYPFPNSANVMYPLVTTAALQFNARAYQALVPAEGVVKAKVHGDDPNGKKAARAERVAQHMSRQLLSEILEWEETTDRLLTVLPIVGEAQRKWWYDAEEGRPRCRLIEPGKFIVNDKAQSKRDAPRCTEELSLYPFEVESRIRSGTFVEFDYQNSEEDDQSPVEFIEQHGRFDLDEDGYPEPYIATVHLESGKLVRLVADFTPEDVRYITERRVEPQVSTAPIGVNEFGQTIIGEVVTPVEVEVATGIKSIRRGTYFVNFDFLPSMDGGIHGTGLGVLLGDINQTVNTTVNMLLDAGHYASLGGGFIGKELRLKGGGQHHRPGEWKLAQAGGGEIRNSIVPMTFPGPNQVMFEMLGFLLEAGKDVASVKDIMTGDTGTKNMTATTTLALIEQGMMMSNAIFKRVFRAMSEEFRLLAKINAATLSEEAYAKFHDAMEGVSAAADYDLSDLDIEPVADPRSMTKMQEAAKAQLLLQMAGDGLVDKASAAKRVLEAMQIGDVDELIPQADPMAQQAAQMQMDAAQADVVQKRADIELTLAKIESERASALKDMTDAEAEQRRLRLDGLKLMLETERDRLAEATGSTGRVARAPNNQPPQQGNGGTGAGQEAALLGALAGGQQPLGAGAPSPAPVGGMAGQPV